MQRTLCSQAIPSYRVYVKTQYCSSEESLNGHVIVFARDVVFDHSSLLMRVLSLINNIDSHKHP